MAGILRRILQVEEDEWPKLFQFGMFGFLLQMGLGVGFSAGDAAFFSHVGASQLPIVFMLTPIVMLIFTAAYSFLLVRRSIDFVVDAVLIALVIGGVVLWGLFSADLPADLKTALYYVLKLYLVMWYFALYTLFWSYADAYFNIQDAKRLFPLFAAFCALGTASGALIVNQFADMLPMRDFLLVWSVIAACALPLVHALRKRWSQIQENELDAVTAQTEPKGKLSMVFDAFRASRFTQIYTLVLFIILLLTNLIEYQYATVLETSRSETELAELFGALYAIASIFNLIVCIFVFNRLVSRFGVRNVAFILPVTYFLAFGFFFLHGGELAAIAAFFAYHGVLMSVEYNNQNFLFNAVPSAVKKPLRAIIEGMCEPLASFFAGGFLIYAAHYVTQRELSGIGVIAGALLIVVVVMLRHSYPSAMAANMRQGSLHFGDLNAHAPRFSPQALARLRAEASGSDSRSAGVARALLGADRASKAGAGAHKSPDTLVTVLDTEASAARAEAVNQLCNAATPEDIHLIPALTSTLSRLDRDERRQVIALLGKIGDTEAIQDILVAAGGLPARERRAVAAMLVGLGETAIPHVSSVLRNDRRDYRTRSIAAHALADLSYAQFASQVGVLVEKELSRARSLRAGVERLNAERPKTSAISVLAQAQKERVARAVDFALELLALNGKLPNFDLLIASLHSTNAKVQANAFEAIESSVDYKTYRAIDALLRPQQGTADGATHTDGDITLLIEAALEAGHGVEAVAAAQALHERLSEHDFAQHVARVAKTDMPAMLHRQLVRLLNLGDEEELCIIQRVNALRQTPDFNGAPLSILAELAQCARYDKPGGPSVQIGVREVGFWITQDDIRDVALRRPELALMILRTQEERKHAA